MRFDQSKKMKKKLFILVSAGCMTLSLLGCGSNSSTSSTSGTSSESTSSDPAQNASASGTINVNTTYGTVIAYAKEGEEIKFKDDFPVQTLQFSGAGGAKYVLEAKPETGKNLKFLRWTKNGAEYSTDAKTTITIDGNAEYYAVFKDMDAENAYDYLVLVNKTHKLPDDWESNVVLKEATNRYGEKYKVEMKALEQFTWLQKELADEGIYIELDSTTRSVAEQQKLWDDWTVEKGEDYVKKYVAVPGYSEHHTGLAIDVCLDKDGKRIDDNDAMIAEREIFAKVHEKLAKYGFILRYLEGKDAETGYSYEPWHFRYIDDPAIAKEIMDKGITLEAYLGETK